MNGWHTILRDLKAWLQRKHIFALDTKDYYTLRLVAEREQCTPEEAASRLFEQAARQQESTAWAMKCWELLSPRQKQIAAYICRGDTTRQIAEQLNISPSTVKSHVEAVLRKFNVNSRVALRQILSCWNLNDYL